MREWQLLFITNLMVNLLAANCYAQYGYNEFLLPYDHKQWQYEEAIGLMDA
ncbi:hypothetical protein [Reichenbachiella ulvae]|uniref:Uncharacterized protein n=1 Tax=Reichenbachiella ulvae TaxID=2980104 RepID=A0ABT3CYY1_9BACT|nr:hypothetical protein [Reichenbachiella ulvae]MCV9388908.1 hypothetical protein [Reichenbachiella ulvae]